MTVKINKSTLLTQIDTIISNLNLSTDKTTKLSLYYKTAVNAGAIASSALSSEIISRLESASSADDVEELILLTLAGSIITNNRSNTVANFASLELLTSVSPGSIYFVLSENAPYVKKNNGTWVLIDPTRQTVLNGLAWGDNINGQLSDRSTIAKSSPVNIIGGWFSDWVQVSAGTAHSIGLRANGTAWAWGLNSSGQLGDNTTTARSSPVSVVGGFNDWVQVSAGSAHSLGVRANGSAWAWGLNDNGRLGDDSITTRSSPVSVAGGFSDWVQMSAGADHSLAIRANGSAWAWGNNQYGQLGDDSTTARSSPVSVVGDYVDWFQMSAGNSHSLAVRANGSAWAWGSNANGRLGDDTVTVRSSPVSVVGGFTDWVQVSAGTAHSIGLRANGTAWAWGSNDSGKLGDNSTTSSSSPVSVAGGFSDWIQVSGGTYHSLGVRANGSAWAWGLNTSGQLGDNSIIFKSSPVSVGGGFADWVQVSAGGVHSLGVRGG
jgi:alpha-tubulin suppressor-like RCC1 family protein